MSSEENRIYNDKDSHDPECTEILMQEEAIAPVSADSPVGNTYNLSARDDVSQDTDYVPSGRYERALLSVNQSPTLKDALKITDYAIVLTAICALLFNIGLSLGSKEFSTFFMLLFGTGIPFAVVSLMRRLINAPRPYELLPFYSTPPKSKRGQSFPSRHVFSIFVIAVAICPLNITLGIVLLALGVILAICRVLLGYHFIRDVVAGALIGVLSGLIGVVIFTLTR